MARADGWLMCRVGFVETIRALGLVAGPAAVKAARREWPAFAVIEVDQALVEDAAALATTYELRSLDAVHLAAALLLPPDDLVFATWDRRLQRSAGAVGLAVLPEALT
jgi:predicted nucleic acid-binding protein